MVISLQFKPGVKFGSVVSPSSGSELSEVIVQVQSYLLSSSSVESNYFFYQSSLIECVELLERSVGSALQSGYDVWTYVDFCDRERNLKKLFSNYEKNPSAECVDGDNLSFSAPETLCVQTANPRQPPKIGWGKVQSLLH